MTTTKKTILFFHRWLGIITGLVVFIVSITGCIFCFQDEIQDALHNYRSVTAVNRPYLTPSILKQTALKQHPGATASYIYYYGKDRPTAVLATIPKQGLLYIYLNPYTGIITHTEDPQYNFFTVVEYIHLYLLLPAKAGTLVVGSSVILFLIIMITGIVLWWPKRKTDRKRGFTIKWNGRWRRVNYDLHNVLGFYAASIAIVLAITGLSMAFDWVREGIYTSVNLGRSYPMEKAYPKSDSLLRITTNVIPAIDKAFSFAQTKSPQAQMFLIYNDAGLAGTVSITAYAKSLHYYKSDIYYFDKYNGKLLRASPFAHKSPGMKINDMNYDLHVGQVLGITGKIIAFLVSLICATLPITGLIVWLGKGKKSKNKVKKVVHRRLLKQHEV